MAKPYKSLTISENDDFDKVCATVLDYGRAIATVVDHGGDPEEFLAERGAKWREAPTLGELREFLGY